MNAPTTLTRNQNIVSWIFQVLAAVIFIQSLFFKFSGAEESIYIFSQLGVEPWGRIGTGIVELIASILLLVPRFASIGALLSLGVISGAILSHLAVLGIAIEGVGDDGTLFGMAIAVFIASLVVLIIRRKSLPIIGEKL